MKPCFWEDVKEAICLTPKKLVILHVKSTISMAKALEAVGVPSIASCSQAEDATKPV